MGASRTIVLLVLAGCGRIAFDPLGDGADDGGAGSADGGGGTGAFAHVGGGMAATSGQVMSIDSTLQLPLEAGLVLVVAAGWEDSTSVVTSVSDTNGNTFTAGVPLLRAAAAISQVVYYAPYTVTSAPNTITVTFDTNAGAPHLFWAVYRGVDLQDPVANASGGTGLSTLADSGPMTLPPNALLVGALISLDPATAPGPGFTQRQSFMGSLFEDRVVTTGGDHSATAPLSGNGGWVMQALALRAR
jgi:hypothetical protein